MGLEEKLNEDTGLQRVKIDPVIKKNITYSPIEDLKNFACRAVYVDGKSEGIYHIKVLKKDLRPSVLCAVIVGMVENASTEIIDPDGTLKLEYPISMKVESILSNEIIEDSLKEVDQIIDKES
jgi:hypothetical protein